MMLIMLKEFIALIWLLRIPPGTTIPLSSFYSYGYAAGDTQLPSGDEASSPSITLPASFLYYGTSYSTLFVNNNGYLSFGLAWSWRTPAAFPIPTYPVVAPYLADVDTRANGSGSVWYRTTQNAALLAKATTDISSLTGTTVNPQWLFIATWDHVGYCCAGIVDKANTFQAVLATDNARSYAILLYANGLIQWPSSGAQVGFNAGNNVNYVNIPGSRTSSILNIASSSNVGVGGQWVFLISQVPPPCGVVQDYSEGVLTLSRYVKCYDQPYSSYTTTSDLTACNDAQIVFVGAKRSISSNVFATGAFGSPYVFAPTSSFYDAYYDPGGAYWYSYSANGFGFASVSNVALGSCDNLENSCASRLCWHLDNNNGGYRAGCAVALNDDQTWRKVIYKGDNSMVSCNPDECALGVSGCNQICTNTISSYLCSCYQGYEISSNDRTCVDIDECAIGISGCNQACNNNNGSFVCSCHLGYQMSANNRTCVDIDECALGASGCNQICNNTNGSFACSCYLGYQTASNSKICLDKDECALGISGCNQICTNTIGSFVCSCQLGYQISANNPTCVDIDECALGISGCNQICSNNDGSFACSCYHGYQISANNRTCVDSDECALGISGCNQICSNNDGSFVCSCHLGYQMSANNRTCVDIDECALGISGCHQICNNTNGSFVCSCYLGYQAASNSKICFDVNECVTDTSECNQNCTNTNGSYMCDCYSGYVFLSDNKTCIEDGSIDTTIIIGVTLALGGFATFCCFLVAFICYKWLTIKRKKNGMNPSSSKMTSGDLPGIHFSQCEAYELVNVKTSRPAKDPPVIDNIAYAISSAARVQREGDSI